MIIKLKTSQDNEVSWDLKMAPCFSMWRRHIDHYLLLFGNTSRLNGLDWLFDMLKISSVFIFCYHNSAKNQDVGATNMAGTFLVPQRWLQDGPTVACWLGEEAFNHCWPLQLGTRQSGYIYVCEIKSVTTPLFDGVFMKHKTVTDLILALLTA